MIALTLTEDLGIGAAVVFAIALIIVAVRGFTIRIKRNGNGDPD
jgi:hypothetical protein